MADNEFTKVSTGSLPIEDIGEILRYEHDFITAADKATDVKEVGGIAANKIAVAVSADDRETIKNAENLGGVPASDYMTKVQGGEIVTESGNIKTIYSSEISELRDEVYQLMEQLSKSGVVTNYKPYSGFIDTFKQSYPVHSNDIIATVIEDSPDANTVVLDREDWLKLDVTDWIILKQKNSDNHHVAQIKEVKPDGQTIIFEPSCSWSIIDNQAEIYKSLGMVQNGAFCFFKKAALLPDSKDMHSCLNDDTYRLRRKITSHHSGYGYTFRIPETQKGFLINFEIQVKTHGTPGALMCYIIDERKIKEWKNAVQAEEDGLLLAKSQPYVHDAVFGERIIQFNFWNGTSYPLLIEADTVDHKVRYCAIIEALDADETDNYYEIVFLQHKANDGTLGDLQLNNITFWYLAKEKTSPDYALKSDTIINSTDMYFGVTTRGVINNGIVPYREGVYTANFRTSEPVEVSRARLAMRINREGYYQVDLAEAKSFSDNSSLPVKKEPALTFQYDMNELGGFGFKRDDDDIIIGTQIRHIKNQTASSVVLEKGVYGEPEQPIYRAGYVISLKARHIVWNSEACVYKEIDKAKIQLPLIHVMPDVNKKDIKLSDRLIYANTFTDDNDKPRFFNDFELQIYWQTEYSGLYNDSKYKQDFVGRIHNLTLSLSKTI